MSCEPEKEYNILYPAGSLVYSVPAAQQGKMELICTKRFFINADQIIYVDTFNALWNETDLCSQERAVELATAYLNEQLEELDEWEDA